MASGLIAATQFPSAKRKFLIGGLRPHVAVLADEDAGLTDARGKRFDQQANRERVWKQLAEQIQIFIGQTQAFPSMAAIIADGEGLLAIRLLPFGDGILREPTISSSAS